MAGLRKVRHLRFAWVLVLLTCGVTPQVLAQDVSPAGICMDCPGGPGGGNTPPQVYLTAPSPGQSFTTGTVVSFTATAADSDGVVNRVEFLVDGYEVAQDTTSPYSATWTATTGSHTVQARAVDNDGAPRTTLAMTITVTAVNQAPSVTLTAPANGATYTTGNVVTLSASASDTDGTINRVEFLVDGAEVAQDTTSPYAVNWTALAGSHTIQARAVDNLGKPTTTAAITVQGNIAPVVATAARQYSYDQYQRLCKVEEPETGATLMGYDAAGNLAWSAAGLPASTACDAEGDTAAILARKAVRTYDTRNRVTALDFADGQADVAYSYTANGQLGSLTAYNGGSNLVTTTYTYNRRGLPIQELMTWNAIAWPISYGYTANGHLSTLGYPGSVSVAYAPNALGQPTQAGTYASNVSYYPNGAMQSFTYGNGIVHTLTRNARGLSDRSLDAYGTTKILDDGYDYDASGNVAAISDGATGRNQRGNRTMAYDGLNRLTAVQSPMYGSTGAAYGYDSLDNLVHVVAPGRDHYYCYDTNNRLTNVKTGGCDTGATVIGLGYDVQGNLANRSGVAYTFDQGNRLRGVSSPASAYVYDGHGRRVRDGTGGDRYSLYSQSGQLVYAQNGRDTTQHWYVSLNGSLVAIRARNYSTNVYSTAYQHTDALGSPVAVTNESRTVVQRSEYEPYGKLLNRAMEDGPGYTGHMTDAATGLVYMQQRYYDPGIDGRFLSVDPVTANSPGGTFNRYWYANANPYRFTDPDGRYSCSAGKAACASLAKAIQMIHDAAAKSTNSRVIAVSSMLGELGDPGVDISDKLRKPTNLGEAHTAGGTTTIGINFKQLDDIAEIASVVGHEGSHGVDQRARGAAGLDPMSNSRSELTISELRAGETEAKIFQALGSDNPFGLYTTDEGVNWQGINSQADLSVNQMCGGEHVCDP